MRAVYWISTAWDDHRDAFATTTGRRLVPELYDRGGTAVLTVPRRGRTYRLTRILFPGRDYRRLDVTGAWDEDCYAAYVAYGCAGVLWRHRGKARPPDVAKLPGLRWLEIEGPTRDLSWVSQCTDLTSLTAHFRVRKGATTLATVDVAPLKRLRHLMTAGCRVLGFTDLPDLETLDIEVFDPPDPERSDLLAGLRSAPSVIRVAATAPFDVDLEAIASASLEELRLGPARLTQLEPLDRCSALTTLDLTLTAESSPLDLAPLSRLPRLAILVVRGDRPVANVESLAMSRELGYAAITAPLVGTPSSMPAGWSSSDDSLSYTDSGPRASRIVAPPRD